MPSRIISSKICDSDSMSQLPWFEQVLFLRLIVSCDDFGRYDGRAKVIKGRLFPLDDVTEKKVEDGLALLSRNEMVSRYMVAGKPYISLCAWSRYNTTRAAKSKYPGPDDSDIPCEQMQTDANTCEQMQTDFPVFDIRNSYSNSNFDIRNSVDTAREGAQTHTREKKKKFSPPSVEEVAAYCQERGNNVSASRFVDFYAAKGWKVGTNAMKDWKAAVRTWEGRDEMPRYGGKKDIPKGASGYGSSEDAAIAKILAEDIPPVEDYVVEDGWDSDKESFASYMARKQKKG